MFAVTERTHSTPAGHKMAQDEQTFNNFFFHIFFFSEQYNVVSAIESMSSTHAVVLLLEPMPCISGEKEALGICISKRPDARSGCWNELGQSAAALPVPISSLKVFVRVTLPFIRLIFAVS